ncbi:glycosyltransferase family 2 protein [Thalassobellus suaedae]|uniref:Glycosyltransferase family 2 protein n=1 Tax=Thalassobellus suaedae TaxID=3074124 RepID=A0ABY9XUN7_9FLAO|nr:glycosyltransferase family 2 protein [Flavobacteriaceae bacterium HL-DH14]
MDDFNKQVLKDVSIIFVNYNTRALTIDALKSVYAHSKTLNLEIIVVDNASQDTSVEAIKKEFPKVILIENKINIGFGRANNLGMKIAKGKYLFLLNTDTYLLNNAIEVLFGFMELSKNKDVAVVGAQLFKPDLTHNVSAGNFPDFKAFVKASLWRFFYSKTYFNHVAIPKKLTVSAMPYEVDYVSGADFFVRKELIDEVGGFNKRFFMYYEETELTHRIKKRYPYKRCMLVPAAKIVHISQGSNKTSNTDKKFKYRLIKSKATYFALTEGWFYGLMYYIVAIKRLIFNNKLLK